MPEYFPGIHHRMKRVRFNQSKNTQVTIPRNHHQKWWEPGEVPFVQLLRRQHRSNMLTPEELNELMAYEEEKKRASRSRSRNSDRLT